MVPCTQSADRANAQHLQPLMPPPSLLYVQMLVTQRQTLDTRGRRRTHLKSQVRRSLTTACLLGV